MNIKGKHRNLGKDVIHPILDELFQELKDGLATDKIIGLAG